MYICKQICMYSTGQAFYTRITCFTSIFIAVERFTISLEILEDSLVYIWAGRHSPLHSLTKSIAEQLPHAQLILLQQKKKTI